MKLFVEKAIEEYAFAHTHPEPELLAALEARTHAEMSLPQMLTGRLEGRFLKLLVQIARPRLIVEVGMFTGYSALSMAEGLPEGGRIITCDIDPKAQRVAQETFDQSPYGKRIEIRMGPALKTIQAIAEPIDLAFIDADKTGYPEYYEAILARMPSGGVIVLDNMFQSGGVLDPKEPDEVAIAKLNEVITRDARVENVLLTIRDGVQLARKI